MHLSATYARSSPTVSFQPQPTQNTALIIEHRCLYTHDLRRKAKRWQDGFLRFHTFNKRVMVYDVPRNYIGDTHWREDEPIQDGDELELDRPILVQVGDHIGSAEQDLTALLEKKSRKDCASMGDQQASPDARSPTANTAKPLPQSPLVMTQLRPKSLNALLGRRSGPIGKASLPTKSPYEVRRAAEDASGDRERPAKRLRVEEPTQRRDRELSDLQTNIHGATSNDEKPGTSTAGEGGPVCAQSNAIPRTMSRIRVRPQTREVESSLQNESIPRLNSNATPTLDKVSKPGTYNPPSNPRGVQGAEDQKTPSKLPEIIEVLSDAEARVNDSSEQPTARTKLRLASRKPRKKLMYRDLLPPDASVSSKISESASHIINNTITTTASSGGEIASTGSPSHCHHEQDDCEAHLQMTGSELEGTDEVRPGLQRRTSHSSNLPLNDSAEKHTLPSRSPRRPRTMSHAESHIVCSNEAFESTIHNTNLALARMDEILLSRSQHQLSTHTANPIPVDDSEPIRQLALASSEAGLYDSLLQERSPTTELQAVPDAEPPVGKTVGENVIAQADEVRSMATPKAQQSCMDQDGTNHLTRHAAAVSFETATSADISAQMPSSKRTNSVLQVPVAPLPEVCTAVRDSMRPADPSAENLSNNGQAMNAVKSIPSFKPHCPTKRRPRSPIHKSISDPSAIKGSQKMPGVGKSITEFGETTCGQEQLAKPWSSEAWDLFGCGRNGTLVDFKSYCLNERP